jgi:hypothetical protein
MLIAVFALHKLGQGWAKLVGSSNPKATGYGQPLTER